MGNNDARDQNSFEQMYGLSVYAFTQHLIKYTNRKKEVEEVPACSRLPYDKDDAVILKELLELVKDKPEHVELLCMMMDIGQVYMQSRLIEKATPLIPKMQRANSVGMFFAPIGEPASN